MEHRVRLNIHILAESKDEAIEALEFALKEMKEGVTNASLKVANVTVAFNLKEAVNDA